MSPMSLLLVQRYNHWCQRLDVLIFQVHRELREQPADLSKYDDTVRQASRPAGPGRGHTGKREGTALEEAEAVLKKPKPTVGELQGSIRNLVGAHKSLQKKYLTALSDRDRAYVLLKDDYSLGGDEKDEVRRADRRAVITELIGEGYDNSSERTFERHKALVLGAIKQIAGRKNTLAQQQLAEAVLGHYVCNEEAAAELGSVEYIAHAAVIAGIVVTLETLRKRNKGRYTSKV
jgi:hypothetical protein